MNLIKQAFIEFYRAYQHQFNVIHRNWQKQTAIKKADNEFSRTGIPHFVLKNGQGDYKALSQPDIEQRLNVLKKNGELPQSVTMNDVRKEAVYVTKVE